MTEPDTQPGNDQFKFEAEYARLKDDMLFRLKSANEFELGAITAMAIILTLGNVFGNGQFFYIGNIAAGAVLFGCAQCVVANIYTVYSAFAYIRAQVKLGHYTKTYLWDEYYSPIERQSGAMPPDLVRRNHHSILFFLSHVGQPRCSGLWCSHNITVW